MDAGPWQYVEPVGKLSDSLTERYDFEAPLKPLQAGAQPPANSSEHVIRFRSMTAMRTRQRQRQLSGEIRVFCRSAVSESKATAAVIGVITAISVAGVAVGVASLIVALAITNGMSRDLRERLLSSTAHVLLMRVQNDGIHNWRGLTDRLRGLPHVTAAAAGLYEPF